MINSATCIFRMTNYKIFSQPFIKLPRLDSSLKMFDSSNQVKVSLKRHILKPKVKINNEVAKMFQRDSYVFMWNVHSRSKEMLIRSIDLCIFIL